MNKYKPTINGLILILVFCPCLVFADIQSCLQANSQLADDAIEICAEALQTPGISADDQSKIYITQAAYLIKKNQFNQAENALELAFNINPKMLENGEYRYNWLQTKGKLFFTKEEFVNALPFFEQAVNVAEIMQSNNTMAISYNNLGATYLEIDNYTQALIWLQKCLAINNAENNVQNAAVASANIAEIYFITEEYDQALTHFNASIELYQQAAIENPEKRQGLEVAQAKIFLSIANLQVAINNFDQALVYFQQAMDIYQQFNLKGEQVKVLSTIGKMYLQQSKSDTAMSFLLQAQAIEDSLESQDNLDFRQVMVDALVSNNQWQKAENLALTGLSKAISKNNQLSEIGFLSSLAVINQKSGNLTQSITYLKQAQTLKEELLENKYDNTRAKLLAELESGNKQKQLTELQEQKTINQLEIKQQRLMFSLFALALLMLVGVLLFKLLHRRKVEQIISRDQSVHNNELMELSVNKATLKQLFKGMDGHWVCFDLTGSIQYSSEQSILSAKMSEQYPEIWQQITAALDKEDLLSQDLYLDPIASKTIETVMIHQMSYLDNLMVALFLPTGASNAAALTDAENIRKYTEFKLQLVQLNAFAQQLPISQIATINPILMAAKALKINANSTTPDVATELEFKEALVELMVMCLDYWHTSTKQSAIELAEQSGLWLVSIENGQLRTRTMNRYAHVDKIPDNPRWIQVVKTAHFVLSHGDLNLNQRQLLNDKIDWLKNHMRNRFLGH